MFVEILHGSNVLFELYHVFYFCLMFNKKKKEEEEEAEERRKKKIHFFSYI